jgi:hypothetical protein
MSEETAALVPTSGISIAQLSPEMAERLLKLPVPVQERAKNRPKPTTEQFLAVLNSLPATRPERDGLKLLIERTNSDKEGIESGASRGTFKPRTIKIDQGIGDDPVKPPDLPKGTLYDSQGYVVPAKSQVVLLMIQRGRSLWPPKDSDDAGKKPLCSSPDQKRGTEHGACETCSFATKKINEGGCGRSITAYMLSADASVIYRVIFSKTSYNAGELAFRMANDSPAPWEHYFTLDVQSQTGGTGQKKNTWFTFRLNRALDGNKQVIKTPAEMQTVYSHFSRLLWHEVYLTDMLFTYAKAPGDTAPRVSEQGLGGRTDLSGNPIGKVGENPSFDNDVGS